MKKLLVVTNGVIPSGYEKVARGLLKPLCDSFFVHHIALGYRGAPLTDPWAIYPTSDADRYGANLYQIMHASLAPEITLFINDGWVLQQYPAKPGQWAYIAVDSPYMVHMVVERINQLEGAIFHTEFAQKEAVKAGVTIPTYVLPHGHDPQFKPVPRRTVRKQIGMGRDLFVVGNVNVNQERKRFDLTLYYFAEWVKRYNLPKSVRLALQPLKNSPKGTPIYLYADHLGISDRLISMPVESGKFIADDALLMLHNTFDVQMTTTYGESWGLTTMDGMMCGVPQIVPDWAGLGEWSKGAVHQVPCTNVQVTHLGTVGGIADKDAFIDALHRLYTDEAYRKELKRAGFNRVHESRFEWAAIARQFEQIVLADQETRA